MRDEFANHSTSLTSPLEAGGDISPDDAMDLPHSTRAIYVGQGGDLRVRLISGDTVTLTGVVEGMIYPLRADRIYASGTSAGALVGLR